MSDAEWIKQLHQVERRGKGLLDCLLAEFKRLPKGDQDRLREKTAGAAMLINDMTQTQLDAIARLRKGKCN